MQQRSCTSQPVDSEGKPMSSNQLKHQTVIEALAQRAVAVSDAPAHETYYVNHL
jgi:hypothetical protein